MVGFSGRPSHEDLRTRPRLLEGLAPGLVCLFVRYLFISSHACPWCPFWPALNPSPPSEVRPSPPLACPATWASWLFLKETSSPWLLLLSFSPSGTLLPQVHTWPVTLDIRVSAQCCRCLPLPERPSKAPRHISFPCRPVLSPSEPKNTLFIGSSFIICLSQALGSPKEPSPHQALPRSQGLSCFPCQSKGGP